MKIVLATDGSSNAEFAALMLSRVPHSEPLELTVLTTVFVPDADAGTASDAWLPQFKKEQYDTAREHYDHIAAMFDGADATLTHKVCEGHVGHSITETADAVGAELIVLGAKGHSAVNRIMLGSISDFVATQAHCGVLVVRPPSEGEAKELRVTIAHENSAESDAAIAQFSQFNWGSGVQGHVLNVVPIVRTFRHDLVPDMVFERAKQMDAAKKAVARVVEQVRQVAPSLESAVVDAEHVGDAIVDFAQENRSNLIVVGEHHRSALGRLMLGSVSRFVLRHAECSVWIARQSS